MVGREGNNFGDFSNTSIDKKIITASLTLIRLGGGIRHHHWRYLSTISKRFEIMSSYLKTFNFITFPKHRLTQFSKFFAKISKICNWRQQVSMGFTKKRKKKYFFNVSSNKSYFFCLKLNSMWKILSFEVLHVEIAQKLQKLAYLLILLISEYIFSFCHFFGDYWKKILKEHQMNWNWCHFLEGTWFLR